MDATATNTALQGGTNVPVPKVYVPLLLEIPNDPRPEGSSPFFQRFAETCPTIAQIILHYFPEFIYEQWLTIGKISSPSATAPEGQACIGVTCSNDVDTLVLTINYQEGAPAEPSRPLVNVLVSCPTDARKTKRYLILDDVKGVEQLVEEIQELNIEIISSFSTVGAIEA